MVVAAPILTHSLGGSGLACANICGASIVSSGELT
jgi:hypothetical protein